MFYHTRIIKLPYSISSAGLVALPLTYNQLLDFDIDLCLPENVLGMYPLKDRCFPVKQETKPKDIRNLFAHAMSHTIDKKIQKNPWADFYWRQDIGK